MSKRVRYISEDAQTGRLFYRRVFPTDIFAFLQEPRKAHNVPRGIHYALNALLRRVLGLSE